ncbi:Hypothetical protein SMAX5B_018571 [Scophthalmus maximus]|uniref:Uncharacterized protein n=1 Tax=Scophthalmus maximus TaxID=52904 RepID=A0A2U9CA22_SCOMX|nr:Hypothetical protein SMAX5B_018571 [Scophthalmus maximus]
MKNSVTSADETICRGSRGGVRPEDRDVSAREKRTVSRSVNIIDGLGLCTCSSTSGVSAQMDPSPAPLLAAPEP